MDYFQESRHGRYLATHVNRHWKDNFFFSFFLFLVGVFLGDFAKKIRCNTTYIHLPTYLPAYTTSLPTLSPTEKKKQINPCQTVLRSVESLPAEVKDAGAVHSQMELPDDLATYIQTSYMAEASTWGRCRHKGNRGSFPIGLDQSVECRDHVIR
jgi:hypothetical protein